jgi:hypothetical protein
LQYETNKAAEVGRLIGNLGRLGRGMAALPELKEDPSVPAAAADGISTPKPDENGDVKMGGMSADPKAGAAAGAAGKKKKKGKK